MIQSSLKGMVAGIFVALTSAGCVSTQTQTDGSTRVHVSLAQALGIPAPQAAPTSATGAPTESRSGTATSPRPTDTTRAELQSAPRAQRIASTALAGIFAKNPYDGTAKTNFPRVAVTITDWSRSDCWEAVATIWRSASRSEKVSEFTVCPNKSMGFAMNNAAKLHLFMEQTSREHSGNVRTIGPKPPMIAVPDSYPMAGGSRQSEFNEFVQQIAVETGWGPGAPTNIWVVGFEKANAAPKGTADAFTDRRLDQQATRVLESALSCTAVSRDFSKEVEPVIEAMGWRREGGITPFQLTSPVTVFGMQSSKVGVSRNGFENTYSTYLDSVSLNQLVKAASLKLGKDGKSFGRTTKLGVLSATQQANGLVLTCTVDVEG